MEMQINTMMTAGAGLAYTALQPAGGAGQQAGAVAPSNPDQAAVGMAGNIADIVEINNSPARGTPAGTVQPAAAAGAGSQPSAAPGAASQTAVTPGEVNPESVTPGAANQAADQQPKPVGNENPGNSKGVVFSFNALANTEVIKFMDIKGNVVAQIPPRMYLKMMEAMGNSMEEITGGRTTGKILDKIV